MQIVGNETTAYVAPGLQARPRARRPEGRPLRKILRAGARAFSASARETRTSYGETSPKRRWRVGGQASALLIALAVALPAAAQFGHPLKGTWSGDWGTSKDK